MAHVFKDRVLETTTTTGTGNLTLLGAVTGYQAVSTISSSNTCNYTLWAVDSSGNPSGDWECGIATWNGTTLERTTVQASSNAGAAVNLAAGTKYVGISESATRATNSYQAGGTDVALADGGTGASLADPNADRLMFWDDSGSAVNWLTVGAGLAITTTTIANTYGPGVQMLPIMATGMVSRTTSGAALGSTETTTNKLMFETYDFDDTTDEFVQFMVPMPESWDEGTITAKFLWRATATGDCVWGIQGVAISDDDLADSAFGTAQTVTDSVTATTDVMISAATSAMTIAGSPAAGDLVCFQVYRDADAGGDTLTGDALLLAVRLYLTTNATVDT